MRLLMIDNYDSFTYNLVQYLGELGAEVDVVRNDAASVDALRRPALGEHDFSEACQRLVLVACLSERRHEPRTRLL